MLWTKYCTPTPIYMLKLNPQCDHVCSWAFGILFNHDSVTFMMGFMSL